MDKRKIIVTSALPYANGALHLGHLVEYLQTDFWVRYQRMMGNDCVYVCADDTHGTPIMIRARKEGTTPEAVIARSYEARVKEFGAFEMGFDRYGSTNCEENRLLSEQIYLRLKERGLISSRPVEQLYCEHCGMFLPDRFVKGTCPRCGAPDRDGDNCSVCGATYNTTDLRDPHCAICGSKPVMRRSEQLFVELEPCRDFLRKWLPNHTDKGTADKLLEWFNEPLRGWNISRDAPYFGFKIPGYEDKYFYVWLDAPIGYMATLWAWAKARGQTLEDWWQDPKAEIYHFIGKDIVRFHCLFWPAELQAAGWRTPTQVFVHGFLMVNGAKMSKSEGTFISAATYLKHLPAQALRFYYACKLNGTVDDMNLDLKDFVGRVNSDLVGKITNLASRGAQMLNKNCGGRLGAMDAESRALLAECRAQLPEVLAAYERRDFCRAMVLVRDWADKANQLFDAKMPWKLVKEDPEATRAVLTGTLSSPSSRPTPPRSRPSSARRPTPSPTPPETLREPPSPPTNTSPRASTPRPSRPWSPRPRPNPPPPSRRVSPRRTSRRASASSPRPPPKTASRSPPPRPSPSTTSPRSTFASPRSSPPRPSKAPTSSCV